MFNLSNEERIRVEKAIKNDYKINGFDVRYATDCGSSCSSSCGSECSLDCDTHGCSGGCSCSKGHQHYKIIIK